MSPVCVPVRGERFAGRSVAAEPVVYCANENGMGGSECKDSASTCERYGVMLGRRKPNWRRRLVCPTPNVSAIEKGKKPAPPRALVNALAGVLGVDEVALWTVAQREREERLRRRIEGFPRSQGRSVYEAASESLPRADRLDRAIDLLQRVKDPQGRTRLAEAVEGLVGVSCGSR